MNTIFGFIDMHGRQAWIPGQARLPFSEIQWIEFLFVIIGYIINTILLFVFGVSSNSGIIYYCVFVFDEV